AVGDGADGSGRVVVGHAHHQDAIQAGTHGVGPREAAGRLRGCAARALDRDGRVTGARTEHERARHYGGRRPDSPPTPHAHHRRRLHPPGPHRAGHRIPVSTRHIGCLGTVLERGDPRGLPGTAPAGAPRRATASNRSTFGPAVRAPARHRARFHTRLGNGRPSARPAGRSPSRVGGARPADGWARTGHRPGATRASLPHASPALQPCAPCSPAGSERRRAWQASYGCPRRLRRPAPRARAGVPASRCHEPPSFRGMSTSTFGGSRALARARCCGASRGRRVAQIVDSPPPDPTRAVSDKAWYNDEHALTLGVRRVIVQTKTGTTTTDYPVSALSTNPGSVLNPQVGTTALDGDQAGTDTSACSGYPGLCDRPMFPALFITDISSDPSSTAGHWQHGGTPIPPHAVFGTWKAAVRTVNKTGSSPVITVTPDGDPAKNGWNLGAGDPAPSGLQSQGYGAEVRWNVDDLVAAGRMITGHTYRLEFMVP